MSSQPETKRPRTPSASPTPDPGALPVDPAEALKDRLNMRTLLCKDAVLGMMEAGADLSEVLVHLSGTVREMTGANYCVISLADDELRRFSSVHGQDLPEEYRSAVEGLDIQLGSSPCGAAICLREPVVVEDLRTNDIYRWCRQIAIPLGIRAYWSHPILDRNANPAGAIALLNTTAGQPDETQLWVLEALSPLAHHVIEHYRREAALESADVRIASLAASIPGVVYQRVVTPDGDIRYTYISDGAHDLFGVSPEEIVADPQALFDCHAPEYSATFRERLLAASRDLTMWDVEAAIISRDGQRKWTHAIARPHRRADGAVVWDGVILDATWIKETNLRLAAASRAKSEFLANISYELRTPLNTILGFAEMMRDELDGEMSNARYKDYVGNIHESGVDLLKTITDILDIIEIDKNELQLQEDEIDVFDLIRECVDLAKEHANEFEVGIQVRVEDALPRLRADAEKVKQVCINLLSNAIKFSLRHGQVLVTAELNRGGGIALSFADNGIGMDRDFVAKVFEPFIRSDSLLDRHYDGIGLGLTLTKALVALHGGMVDLRSKKDAGTTVTVLFPRERTLI